MFLEHSELTQAYNPGSSLLTAYIEVAMCDDDEVGGVCLAFPGTSKLWFLLGGSNRTCVLKQQTG